MIAVRPIPPRAIVVGKGRLGRALASALGLAGTTARRRCRKGRGEPRRKRSSRQPGRPARRWFSFSRSAMTPWRHSSPPCPKRLRASREGPSFSITRAHTEPRSSPPSMRGGCRPAPAIPSRPSPARPPTPRDSRGITFAIDGSGAGRAAAETSGSRPRGPTRHHRGPESRAVPPRGVARRKRPDGTRRGFAGRVDRSRAPSRGRPRRPRTAPAVGSRRGPPPRARGRPDRPGRPGRRNDPRTAPAGPLRLGRLACGPPRGPPPGAATSCRSQPGGVGMLKSFVH